MPRDNDMPLDELKAQLVDRLEDLSEKLLGPPNPGTLHRREWRWGNKGSTALIMSGVKGKGRGSFYSHEGETGGSPLDLIMFARNCELPEANPLCS